MAQNGEFLTRSNPNSPRNSSKFFAICRDWFLPKRAGILMSVFNSSKPTHTLYLSPLQHLANVIVLSPKYQFTIVDVLLSKYLNSRSPLDINCTSKVF